MFKCVTLPMVWSTRLRNLDLTKQNAVVPLSWKSTSQNKRFQKLIFILSDHAHIIEYSIYVHRIYLFFLQKLVIEDTLEDVNAEMLQSELPERQPRFILYSFELDHGDGRISYPMCLIWSTPIGCKTDLQMMYAGTKLPLVKEAGITKVFEIRELDELTDEWLESRMKGH